jgi:hypothetical protein
VIASVVEKFQHLFELAKYCKFVTQKNFSAAYTKDSGEKNVPKSPYLYNRFQQVAKI